MLQALLVGLGGFVGAVLRYSLSGFVQRVSGGGFPLGTLVVNGLGSLLIGVCLGLALVRQGIGEEWRLVVVVGLLGSLTTFSTFRGETLELLRAGDWGRALGNVGANVLLALAATAVGIAGVRVLVGSS